VIQSLPHLVLWLYVVNLGIAFGAGVYERRVAVPLWFRTSTSSPMTGAVEWNPGAARAANPGLRFWVFVTTLPLTLLTLASLLLISGAPLEANSAWWLSLAATLVDRAMTFAYFLPTMISLVRTDQTTPALTARALRWVNLDAIRLVATFVAWIAATLALVQF
jgi:hypothetical protein